MSIGLVDTSILLADLSIIGEHERQCALNPMRRVFIWSRDDHLSAYDRPAPAAGA